LRRKIADVLPDPFAERAAVRVTRRIHLLGAQFQFECEHAGLLRLVDSAYANLPRYRLARSEPTVRLSLQMTSGQRKVRRDEPPSLGMLSGTGLLAGATDGSSFAILSPAQRTGLIAVTPRMLRFPYHTRYELIEFAVFTLAARVLGLMPLHGACVGYSGRGVMLMGPSGAGKSTVTLQSLLEGLEFLCEDSLFVTPDTLLAAGVPNFLHVRADSLRWVTPRQAAPIRRAPVIRRRSGVRKYELDLRRPGYRVAMDALKVCAVVFLSPLSAVGGPLLRPLETSAALRRLAQEQAYAASQPSWRTFARSLSRLPFFELRRGQHPRESVSAVRALLEGAGGT
jgi:hypothetical protein